jgi:hypothetical protein
MITKFSVQNYPFRNVTLIPDFDSRENVDLSGFTLCGTLQELDTADFGRHLHV